MTFSKSALPPVEYRFRLTFMKSQCQLFIETRIREVWACVRARACVVYTKREKRGGQVPLLQELRTRAVPSNCDGMY